MMELVFDAYNICYASYYALKDELRNPINAAIFGFFKTILNRVENVTTYTKVYWVFDNTQGDTWRHRLYPDYKANRKVYKSEQEKIEKEQIFEEIHMALSELRELVQFLPITTIEVPGIEADDLIANLAMQATIHNKPLQIISSDKDFIQLVSPFVSVYSPLKNKEINIQTFPERCTVKEITIRNPKLWLLFRVLSGDHSDNIIGISGIGEITAAKIVATIDDLTTIDGIDPPSYLDYFIDNMYNVLEQSGIRGWKKTFEKLCAQSSIDQLKLNNELMCLSGPYQARAIPQENYTPGRYSSATALDYFEYKEFKSLLHKIDHIFLGMQMRYTASETPNNFRPTLR